MSPCRLLRHAGCVVDAEGSRSVAACSGTVGSVQGPKKGIPAGVAVKSLGLPWKFQASPQALGLLTSLVPLKSLARILNSPGCPGLDGYDGIDPPSLQDLSGRFDSGERVGDLQGEPMPDVVVAVPVIPIRERVVERDRAPKILRNIVQTVAVGVRSGERQAMGCPLRQAELQGVVVRPILVR